MADLPLRVLAVSGSLGKNSAVRALLRLVAEELRAAGAHVDVLDLADEPLPLFNPDTAYLTLEYPAWKARVEEADVLLLATPDYHGSISSTLKNFLEHFWEEYAGKLFATIVGDQLRTVARQCYAWSLPYAVAFAEKTDMKDGQISSDSFRNRVGMLVRDVRVYGELLARQRRHDLAGKEAGFLAKRRK
jgi:FMN reductase